MTAVKNHDTITLRSSTCSYNRSTHRATAINKSRRRRSSSSSSSSLTSRVLVVSTIWISLLLLVLLGAATAQPPIHTTTANNNNIQNQRQQYICSLSGGLDVVRLSSSTTRLAFKDALEDVEFIRQYIAEAARNNNNNNNNNNLNHNNGTGSRIGMTLDELSLTLDYEARNLSAVVEVSSNSSSSSSTNSSSATTTTLLQPQTTLTAGLGYADDRANRRIERFVSVSSNQPLVGTKQTDFDLIQPTEDIFPWMVDRTTAHDNPRAAVPPQSTTTTTHHHPYDRLYVAAWIGTMGEAWMYYPSLQTTYGHPLSFGDILGEAYNSHDEEFVQPNLPLEGKQQRIDQAYFTAPYPDTAVPGLSLITAQAPIYYTGEFQGYTYDQTYIASTGVDISVDSMASFLDDLEGTLTRGSFAMVVGVDTFATILISQSTVDKLYPRKTGREASRVTYAKGDGSIVSDRRNQPYQVSDTIFQPPTNLTNSPDWKTLASSVQALEPGQRSSSVLNITLTGDTAPTAFYVMYERWAEVADWALLLFVPQDELDTSIVVEMVEPAAGTDLQVQVVLDDQQHIHLDSSFLVTETVLRNTGVLDVTVAITKLPPWFRLVRPQDEYTLPAGESLTLTYVMTRDMIPQHTRVASSLIALTIKDDNYGNCFYEQVLTTNVFLSVTYGENLNQLDRIRPYGFTLSVIIVMSALGCSVWVFLHALHPVVKAAQPIFLHVMCAGILVMGLSIIPLGIDDSSASDDGCSMACMAFPWLLSIGFSIAYAALFSKVWRINQIVAGAKKYKRVDVSTRDVMVPFVVICTLNVTLLSVWSGVDPLTWVRESSNGVNQAGGATGGGEDSYGYCSLNDSTFGLVCFILLLLVNFGALVLALIQLYRARELSTEYSEGKYIAIAMGSMIQVFLTGLPILVIVTDSPQVSYFVKSTIVFTVAMSLLLLTFVPKFYITNAKKHPTATSHSVGGINRPAGRPVSPSESELQSLPLNSMVVANGSSKNYGHTPEQRRVMFSEDDDDDDDTLMRNHPTIQMPAEVSRARTVSDISVSLTMSEFERLENPVPEEEIGSPAAPKVPAPLPSAMENNRDGRNRVSRINDDQGNSVAAVGPTQPIRLPSVMEDYTDSSRSDRPRGPDDTDSIEASTRSSARIPLQRTDTENSNSTHASMPKRLPSIIEPNDDSDSESNNGNDGKDVQA